MSFKVSDELPFFWRLRGQEETEYYPARLPFEFSVDEFGLIQQPASSDLDVVLEAVYRLDSNIGYLQEHYTIANDYKTDFLNFLEDHLVKLGLDNSAVKALEIGCGEGLLIRSLQKLGLQVLGVDPSPIAKRASEKYGFDLYPEFFIAEAFEGQNYDLIYHVDILEHLRDPLLFLRSNAQALSQSGFLIVSVPDASDVYKGDISAAMHQHLSYFDEGSLRSILQRAGFEVLTIVRAGYGGSLYAVAKLGNNTASEPESALPRTDFLSISNAFESSISRVSSSLDWSKKIGLYVPTRAIPYISTIYPYAFEKQSGIRYFDDTRHWLGKFIDGTDIPIEPGVALMDEPVDNLVIFSNTFGELIREKLRSYGYTGEINLLKEIIW